MTKTSVRMRTGHQLQLLEGGIEYFAALIEDIDRAVSEVRLETYIFYFEGAGLRVAQALERAAQRGLNVFLVMDGIGTPSVSGEWAQRFNRAGVQWHQFLPLGRLGLLLPGRWRRMHRKLCVVDCRVAYCGGINILDDFLDPNYGALDSPRMDYAVRVTGPLVADVHAAVAQFWSRLEITRKLEKFSIEGVREALESAKSLAKADATRKTDSRRPAISNATAALLLRDNLRNRTRIEQAYRKAIAHARHEVLIANAYFVPGVRLRRALIDAARRGVRVRLLLQGRYEYFMQFHTARQVYGVLMEAGVEIHEYQAGFLHAKVAVVDGRWATVGSSNLDPLSLQLAREANVVVDNRPFAKALHARLTQVMERSGKQVDPARYAQRPCKDRALDGLAAAVVRVTLFLTGRRY